MEEPCQSFDAVGFYRKFRGCKGAGEQFLLPPRLPAKKK